jgi:hypothetical protein
MNRHAVDQIAKAVLYEGYMLYPYRPSSVKNQQRWNFGVLCPQTYCDAQNASEKFAMQTECLVLGDRRTALEIRVRFLHLVSRSVGKSTAVYADPSADNRQQGSAVHFVSTDLLVVNGRRYQPWQEAVEQEIVLSDINLETLARTSTTKEFSFPAEHSIEPLRELDDEIAGVLLRDRSAVSGEITVSAVDFHDGSFQLTVAIRNVTPFQSTPRTSRDEALLHSLVSAHTVLGVEDGAFISLLTPPENFADRATNCKNIGTWPVLIGEAGNADTLLSSPIILYDYPQIAPESAGDLFDGTEIDEILSLRILTLTDEEKLEMSQSDERARQMLERTESMPAEQFMKLHGALRSLRPLKEAS